MTKELKAKDPGSGPDMLSLRVAEELEEAIGDACAKCSMDDTDLLLLVQKSSEAVAVLRMYADFNVHKMVEDLVKLASVAGCLPDDMY